MNTDFLRHVPFLRAAHQRIQDLEGRVDSLKAQRTSLIADRDRLREILGKTGPQRTELEHRTGFLSPILEPATANRQVFLSLKNRFLYVSNPKVACSTIKLSLQRMELEDPALELDSQFVHARDFSPFLLPGQIPGFPNRLRAGNWFAFLFVRNPYTRTLSAFLDKMRGPGAEKLAILTALGRPAETRDEPVSFADFLRGVRQQQLTAMDRHWRPQVHQCMLDAIPFNFAGRFENLEADLRSVVERLGHSDVAHHAPHATKASERFAEFYDQECLDLANEIYAEDFDRLGYRRFDRLPKSVNPADFAPVAPVKGIPAKL